MKDEKHLSKEFTTTILVILLILLLANFYFLFYSSNLSNSNEIKNIEHSSSELDTDSVLENNIGKQKKDIDK